MGEEIAFENGMISNFQGLVTLTLTSNRIILHTVMHHSSSSTYKPIFIKMEKLFVDRRVSVCMDGRTFETHFIRSTLSRPNNSVWPHISRCLSYFRWHSLSTKVAYLLRD